MKRWYPPLTSSLVIALLFPNQFAPTRTQARTKSLVYNFDRDAVGKLPAYVLPSEVAADALKW